MSSEPIEDAILETPQTEAPAAAQSGVSRLEEAPAAPQSGVSRLEEAPAAPQSGVSRLEEEGDVAADYLEELLDIADIDGDIDIEVRNGRTYISIVSEEDDNRALDSLVGEDGEVLEALQELARLAVLTATDSRSRLVLDITGYREERTVELQKIADDAISRAKTSGGAVALEPMSAYERKIVHDAVADRGLVSESEGEGVNRHIVVSLPAD